MATQEEAQQAVLSAIATKAPNASPESLKHLAEAYAWVVTPNNAH